nr:protein phosphatase 1 regulatory subunit 3B-B-like [Lytechinus pictus]
MPARVPVLGAIHVCDMPVDTILLSSSPPGLGCFPTANSLGYYHQRVPPTGGIRMGIGMRGDLLMQMQRDRRRLPLRSCIKSKTVTKTPSDAAENHKNSLETLDNVTRNFLGLTNGKAVSSPDLRRMNELISKAEKSCHGKEKKKVSFADAQGLSLQTVKYMDGPSNMPPKFCIQLLDDVIQNVEANPTHPYTYVPDFEQPASNYLEFRKRLESETVCLENVMIKDNITVVGTIKVKNIAFEKSVFVRATFDEWKTHIDIPGSYVYPSQASNSYDKFDTFSFSLDMPPNHGGKSVEFCVCYTTNNLNFWDSNHGNNYKIVTDKEKDFVKNQEQASLQNLSGDRSYGQFSYWQVTSHEERPYW